MRITFHPLRGPAATAAVRNSHVFDPTVRVHLRFVELNDLPFVATLSPGLPPAARRRWLNHYKLLESQGCEFNFIIVDNGHDRGLVRMHDFIEIDGEPSFRWGDFVSRHPGLLTASALAMYSLGFDTLGYSRSHMVVPSTDPDLAAFHLETGAELEVDAGNHRCFRFSAATYDRIRDDARQRRDVTTPNRF